jgi:hypothetical protein
MIACVHGNRFIDDAQFTREVIKLIAHPDEPLVHARTRIVVFSYVQKAIEC